MESHIKKSSALAYSTDRKNFLNENGTSNEHIEEEIFTADEALNGTGVIGIFQAKLIVFCCFIWMARGADDVLLSYIGSLLACDWSLQRWQTATIVTVSQLVSCAGCIFYGIWSDRYGRRTALSSSLIFTFIFGAVSSGLPNFVWYTLFRTMAAFAVGGLPQAITLVNEFSPTGQRGRTVFILTVFWAIGILAMISLTYSTSEEPNNWRTTAALASAPACIAMLMLKYFPESARYLLISNEDIAASFIVEEVAITNKQNLPRGMLEPAIDWKDRGRFSTLYNRFNFRSSMLFCLMGFLTSLTYWGLTLLAPVILSEETKETVDITSSEKNFLGNISEEALCFPNVTQSEYIEIVWTTALDFPGILIYMILVDIINRKLLLGVSCTVCALFIFLLYIPTQNVIMKTVFIYCSRTLLIPQFDFILLMAAEIYPTTNRGTAIGMCAATFYFGSFLNPYVHHILRKVKILIGFYGGVALLTGFAGALLPIETRNKGLMELPDEK